MSAEVHLSLNLFICLCDSEYYEYVDLSAYMSKCDCACLPAGHVYIHPPVSLWVHISVHACFCASVCKSVCQSVYRMS